MSIGNQLDDAQHKVTERHETPAAIKFNLPAKFRLGIRLPLMVQELLS
jgi:hypothetical protein